MRVALLSDIHANAIALRAVLADIGRHGVDEAVCLGDVATLGPQPLEVVELLRDFGCACIMGNHDEFLVDPAMVHAHVDQPTVIESIEWCRERLSREHLSYVASFRRTCRFDLGSGSTLMAFHGTPGSNTTDLLATTGAADLDELLAGDAATVMTGGHTHVPMLRRHRGVLFVNPGSVGLPFREYAGGKAPSLLARAEYAIVEASSGAVDVRLCQVALDPARLRAAAGDSDMPLSRFLIQQYS